MHGDPNRFAIDIVRFEDGMGVRDIYVLGRQLTERDNFEYDALLVFRLHRAVGQLDGLRPDDGEPLAEMPPDVAHRLLAADHYEDGVWTRLAQRLAFLEFGENTDHDIGFLLPLEDGLMITCQRLGSERIEVVAIGRAELRQILVAACDEAKRGLDRRLQAAGLPTYELR